MTSTDSDSECPVCYENLSRTIQTLPPCSHPLCLSCLIKITPPRTCPLCRMDLAPFFPPPPAPPPSPPQHRLASILLGEMHSDFALPPSSSGSLGEWARPARVATTLFDRSPEEQWEEERERAPSVVVAALRALPLGRQDLARVSVVRSGVRVRGSVGGGTPT